MSQGTLNNTTGRWPIIALLLAVLGVAAASGPAVAKADAVHIPSAEVTDYTWNGHVSGARVGGPGLSNAGDINGDGIDDFITTMRGTAARGLWILFGPIDNRVGVDFANLKPSQGYRVRAGGNPTRANVIGDQNGDGVNDFMLSVPATGTRVVYGIPDPANTLPKCDPLAAPETRCAEITTLVDVNANRIGFSVTRTGGNLGSSDWRPGDFNGDGDEEILIPDITNSELVVARNNLGATCSEAPGLCVVDLAALAAPDVAVLEGPSGLGFGEVSASVGDLNGDGRDDIVTSTNTDGSAQPALRIIYGQNWGSSPVDVTAPDTEDGQVILAAFAVNGIAPSKIGDFNGDGTPDIGVFLPRLIGASDFVVWYGGQPEVASGALLTSPTASEGFLYAGSSDAPILFSTNVVGIGDLNGDGNDEVAVAHRAYPFESVDNIGAVAVLFGKSESSGETPTLGPDMSPDDGFWIVNSSGVPTEEMGGGLSGAGDQDNDGIPDLLIGSEYQGNGTVKLMYGSNFVGQARTGLAAESAGAVSVGGSGIANGRESVAYVEYSDGESGTSTSAEVEIGSSRGLKSLDFDLGGLSPSTTYTYRVVAENDLGLKAFGSKRSFTTADEPDPSPGPCDVNPAAAGCGGFCEANPTSPGCVQAVARMSGLIAGTSTNKVRRGGKVVIRTWITSTGTKAADGITVCATAPKRLVQLKGKRCRTIGSLAPGSTAKAQFTVKVKRKARKGAKPAIKLVAKAQGLGDKTATARFAIR